MINIMASNKLWFFDIFHFGNNILVQRISENKFKPIIIDYKRLGWLSYPLQINLILNRKEKEIL
jgi:hypothetical protein